MNIAAPFPTLPVPLFAASAHVRTGSRSSNDPVNVIPPLIVMVACKTAPVPCANNVADAKRANAAVAAQAFNTLHAIAESTRASLWQDGPNRLAFLPGKKSEFKTIAISSAWF
jgi:hypothetical protein